MVNFRNGGSSSINQVPTLTTFDMYISEYKQIVETLSFKIFNIHTSMTATNEKIVRLNAKNVELIKMNEELDPIAV